jgi:7-cyano-7-deazaguanine synthase in queuosine biosynthesis
LFSTPIPRQSSVALFSGGLDSFAGTAAHLQAHPEQLLVLVSGFSNARQRKQQRKQVDILTRGRQRQLMHVPVSYSLHHCDESTEENTQRTRGFLFLTLGSVIAIAAGMDRLLVFENGVGALNLHHDWTQLDTMSSRPVHPVTLSFISALACLIAERPFHIQNPFLYSTKAEMLRLPGVKQLGPWLRDTFSCDSFPLRNQPEVGQCGRCTSCLLRRLSLTSAGLRKFDPGNLYECDVFSGLDHEHRLGLAKMTTQLARIEAILRSARPFRQLRQTFPTLGQAAAVEMVSGESIGKIGEQFVSLYSRYLSEWKEFLRTGCQTILTNRGRG